MAKKFIYLKKQILAIEDIKETVKALEKIAAANIHNLKLTSQRMKEYEERLKEVWSDIEQEDTLHPLFKKTNTFKKLKILITTEKGLCGSLLNRLLDFFQSFLLRENEDIMVVGEKGKKLCDERGIKINYFFRGTKEIPKEEDINQIRNFVISQFLEKKYSEVVIFYSSFESLALQNPTVFKFLPFEKKEFEREFQKESKIISAYPIYEPSLKEIKDYLIKEYLGLVFYQKILEAKLSELAARTIAMEEAGQKAQELIVQLSHQYMKAKREAVTKDINDLYSHWLIKHL